MPRTTPAPGPVIEVATVCAQSLLVRPTAGPTGASLGTLSEGELFSVERYNSDGQWAYGSAREGQLRGWVIARQGQTRYLGSPCTTPTP